MIGWIDFACYVPEARSSIRSMKTELGLTEEQLRVLTDDYGLRQVAVEPRLRADHMMAQAGRMVARRNPEQLRHVDWILHTHTFNPFTPFLVEPLSDFQREWGLEGAKVRSVSQMNCASLDLLFYTAKLLLEHKRAKAVLLLAADKMFLPNSRYLQDSTVSGDAAAAVLLSRDAHEHRLVSSAIHSDATLYNSVLAEPREFEWFQRSFYVGLVKIMRQALKHAGLAIDQLAYIFPANVNQTAWIRVASALGIPRETFYFPTLPEIGHAHNADPLLNLEAALQNQILRKGDYYATLTVGMGSTFGCTVFQYGSVRKE
ncbi:hypothetical protein DUZ99_17235 [Xylanibacillus composti]|uniref:3-oxoacyl-ACP synthase n=1 Tax=Xylanibacillus composti TaxID=1572762 RepID=A0A8J4M1Z5_9BACL|nr:3-oxoacyl-[acyl-carrier-protein] synthase III C-terminal domain-containing protein [Xylanibacillus composti]MDT9726723.1 hypothetical protein [Xylanibacillus composti]GIQ69345.1 3-oxoacyl-ACP synthase [Xylanibacillus composti]